MWVLLTKKPGKEGVLLDVVAGREWGLGRLGEAGGAGDAGDAGDAGGVQGSNTYYLLLITYYLLLIPHP